MMTSSGVGVVTTSGSTASALLRTLSRRRRRSSASATMSTSSSSSSSSSLFVSRQMDLGRDDDRRLREPASASISGSAFGSVISEVGGTTVKRTMADQWRRATPTCRYVTLPSDAEELAVFSRSSSSVSQTQSAVRPPDQRIAFHATGVSAAPLPTAWREDRRHRLELPPAAAPSLPPEVTSQARRRPQSASSSGPLPTTSPFQLAASRYQQNGDSSRSSPVAGVISSPALQQSGERTSDERRLSTCQTQESLTSTKAVTSTTADVWRPY